jgi:hypothetical protein
MVDGGQGGDRKFLLVTNKILYCFLLFLYRYIKTLMKHCTICTVGIRTDPEIPSSALKKPNTFVHVLVLLWYPQSR